MNEISNGLSALVTGSSRGIGRAIALELARQGFVVTLHFRNNQNAMDETTRLFEKERLVYRVLQFDIADPAQTKLAIDNDMATYGAYYGVVLNAGLQQNAPFPALNLEDWQKVVGTDLNGFFHVLNPLIMPMIQAHRGGRIVTLSSTAGIMGQRGQVHYSAAKAGVIGATKALALELAKRKITVNCVAPGFIDTEMLDGLDKEKLLEMIPMRRLGKPDDVAACVAYLFSPKAGYMTGQVLSLNGGIC